MVGMYVEAAAAAAAVVLVEGWRLEPVTGTLSPDSYSTALLSHLLAHTLLPKQLFRFLSMPRFANVLT